jgi:DsrE/DsrF-like family
MTAPVLVLERGPGLPGAERGLGFAQTWLAQNDAVAAALIQDGGLAALGHGELPAHQRLRAAIRGGARCVYLAEDLARRGFAPNDVLAGCEPTDFDGLAEVLLADGARVIGAF